MSYDLHPALNLYISVNMTSIRIVLYTTPSYNIQLKMAYFLKETMVLKYTAKILHKIHVIMCPVRISQCITKQG